ncbi:MAG: hypothetical protein K1X38_14790 [Microthrixaceae bacterium]|nr:hypothetical protein [Microthrixaceae bacterium]
MYELAASNAKWDSAIADSQGRARPFICGLGGLPIDACAGTPQAFGTSDPAPPGPQVGWQMASDPASITWQPGRTDVFARGLDGALIHTFYADGAWRGWESLGGMIRGEPSVVPWGPGHLDVFARGSDDHVYHRYYSGGWSEWERIGSWQLASDPVAHSRGNGRVDLFGRGLDGALIHSWFDGTWHEWESLGGGLAGRAVGDLVRKGSSGCLRTGERRPRVPPLLQRWLVELGTRRGMADGEQSCGS